METSHHDAQDELSSWGFEGPLACLIDAMPLVEMAWADGLVQPAERAMILAFLDSLLEQEGARAARPRALQLINRFLTTRPTDEQFKALRRLLAQTRLGGEGRERRLHHILEWVNTVGGAATSPTRPQQSWDKQELLTLWSLESSFSR